MNDKNADFSKADFSKGLKLLDSDGNVKLGKVTTLMPLSTLVISESQPQPQPVVPDKPANNENINSDTDIPNIEDNINVEKSPTETIVNNTKDTNVNTAIQTVKLTLTHNAYVYEADGITIAKVNNKEQLLKAGETISVMNNGQPVIINGKKFYQIDNNKYVKVNNTLLWKVLKHNSFVYNRAGKAIKQGHRHLLLKKNCKVLLLDNGKITTIKGKKFYRTYW